MAERTPSATAEVPPATPAAPPPKFPKGAFFVIFYIAAHSFAYYGTAAVLVLYITKQLKIEANTAKTIMHFYRMVASFSPFAGAVIVDAWLGKYRSVCIFGTIYALSYVVLVLSSMPPMHMEPRVLFLIIFYGMKAFGGIGMGPPVISSFGGDQYAEGQDAARVKFFSALYFALNCATIGSHILFPTLRDKFECFGERYCFSLPFGVSTAAYLIAFITFVSGYHWYRIVPPSGTVMKNFFLCVWTAIIQRFKSPASRDHWLDRADVKFSPEFIEGVKAIFGLIVLYLPMPMYEALYSQMDTSWTLQSDQLDGRTFLGFEILPDMMDVINPVLVLILIPLFDFVLYPAFGKINILKTPLQRMCTGGFFVAFSFVLAGFLNRRIETFLPYPPSDGNVDLTMVNAMECPITVYLTKEFQELKSFEYKTFPEISMSEDTFTVVPSAGCPVTSEEKFTLKLKSATAYTVVIQTKPDSNITLTQAEQVREKNLEGNTVIRFIYLNELPFPEATLRVKRKGGENRWFSFIDGFSPYFHMRRLENYEICWAPVNSTTCEGNKPLATINLYKGAIAESLIIYKKDTQTAELKTMLLTVEDHIPILYQFPQYVAITIGEVMLSVTSLSFNYSQAPVTLKVIVASMWILARTFGNMLVVTVLQLKYAMGVKYESEALFFFAALMALDMSLFAYFCHRYTYRSPPAATS